MELTEALKKSARRKLLPEPDELRELREAAGLTQSTMAQIVGVTPPTVSRWERGARRPQGGPLDRYLEVLDVLREGRGSC